MIFRLVGEDTNKGKKDFLFVGEDTNKGLGS
jgi:hypothetical protein